MQNTFSIYEGYLDESERTMALAEASDSNMLTKFLAMYETIELRHECALSDIHLKLLTEGGTYDDYVYLINEANDNAAEETRQVDNKFITWLHGIITAIGNFFKAIFNIRDDATIEVDQNDITFMDTVSALSIPVAGIAQNLGKGDATGALKNLNDLSHVMSSHKAKLLAIAGGVGVIAASGITVVLAGNKAKQDMQNASKFSIACEKILGVIINGKNAVVDKLKVLWEKIAPIFIGDESSDKKFFKNGGLKGIISSFCKAIKNIFINIVNKFKKKGEDVGDVDNIVVPDEPEDNTTDGKSATDTNNTNNNAQSNTEQTKDISKLESIPTDWIDKDKFKKSRENKVVRAKNGKQYYVSVPNPSKILLYVQDNNVESMVKPSSVKVTATHSGSSNNGADVYSYKISNNDKVLLTNIIKAYKLLTPATDPATPATDNKPVTPATDNKPVTPATDNKPATPATDNKPATPATDNKPATPATDNKPATPATDNKPVTPATDNKPVTPATDNKPATPATDNKPATPATDNKPVTPATDNKPVTPATDNKPATPATDNKYGPDCIKRPLNKGTYAKNGKYIKIKATGKVYELIPNSGNPATYKPVTTPVNVVFNEETEDDIFSSIFGYTEEGTSNVFDDELAELNAFIDNL